MASGRGISGELPPTQIQTPRVEDILYTHGVPKFMLNDLRVFVSAFEDVAHNVIAFCYTNENGISPSKEANIYNWRSKLGIDSPRAGRHPLGTLD